MFTRPTLNTFFQSVTDFATKHPYIAVSVLAGAVNKHKRQANACLNS